MIRANRIYGSGNSVMVDLLPLELECALENRFSYGMITASSLATRYAAAEMEGGTMHWKYALRRWNHDLLIILPWLADEIAGCVDILQHWVSYNPGTRILIHEGWPHESTFWAEWSSALTDPMPHVHKAFIDSLVDALRTANIPVVGTTHTGRAMEMVYHDCQGGYGAFAGDGFASMYRDDTHASRDEDAGSDGRGRCLMHNLLRTILCEPLTFAGWPDLSASGRAYVGDVIKRVLTGASPAWSA